MRTPRNLKQALDNGYFVKDIRYNSNKSVLVCLQARNVHTDGKLFLSFWIDRKYFNRTYPELASRYWTL